VVKKSFGDQWKSLSDYIGSNPTIRGVLEHINSGFEAIATRNTEPFIFETAFEKK